MSFAALPNAILFAVTGIVVFATALITVLHLFPGRLLARALEGDREAALIVAALTIAIGWIVAAAVH